MSDFPTISPVDGVMWAYAGWTYPTDVMAKADWEACERKLATGDVSVVRAKDPDGRSWVIAVGPPEQMSRVERIVRGERTEVTEEQIRPIVERRIRVAMDAVVGGASPEEGFDQVARYGDRGARIGAGGVVQPIRDFGQGKQPVRRRGPYGTNEGDTWLMADYFNDRIKKEKGPQWRMCITLVRNDATGVLEERMYSTENPDLVREADEGHEKWLAAQAAMN